MRFSADHSLPYTLDAWDECLAMLGEEVLPALRRGDG